MCGTVAIRNVNQAPAVRGPGDLRFLRYGKRDPSCIATIRRRSREYFTTDYESYFLPIGSERDFGNLICQAQVFYSRSRRGAPSRDINGGRLAIV